MNSLTINHVTGAFEDPTFPVLPHPESGSLAFNLRLSQIWWLLHRLYYSRVAWTLADPEAAVATENEAPGA